ncbi:hypothetical protein IKZ40_08625 [bacterium]|nr:hypothetical protein [bacterium]
MILNRKIKAKGAALVMTVLLLGFFSLMALVFCAMLSLHLGQSRNYLCDNLLENGEQAALAHALALCDAATSNEGLYKTFSSGWQNDAEGEVTYRFRFEDQLKDAEDPFAGFPPLTSPRDALGRERANLAVLDAEEENRERIQGACEEFLKARGDEELAPELTAALLDEIDVDRTRRSASLTGESLRFTGLTKGDNRFLPYWKIGRLSAFFDLDTKTLEPYRGFMVTKTAYEETGGETNLFVTLTEKPYGKEEKAEWDNFADKAGRERIGSLWQDWDWVGETVSFLSSCGGKYVSAKILEARKDGFLLEGKPEVTMGSTVTRSWCNDREERGVLTLKKRDLWLLEGLQTNYSYRVKLGVLKGGAEADFSAGSALTGGYYRVVSGKYGSLPFAVNSKGRSALIMGMEAYSPSYYHFENVSSNALHLASWAILCETPEGEKHAVTPQWKGTPLLQPGDTATVASWFEDNGNDDVTGYAIPSSWAVPIKIREIGGGGDRRGWTFSIGLDTRRQHPRSNRHLEYSIAYLPADQEGKRLTPFPVLSQEGNHITIFVGNRDNAYKYLRSQTVYLGDFALESLRNEVYILDQWGQKTALFNSFSEIPNSPGYHRAEDNKIERKDIAELMESMHSDKIILPFAEKAENCTETKFKVKPVADDKLTFTDGVSFREDLLKGCDLITKDGEVFRITASTGATVTLDRNHGLKGGEEVIVAPDGKEIYLLNQSYDESVWLLKLPPEALLPGDLYLPGHAPFPRKAVPKYNASVYNRELDLWEPRLKFAKFPEGGVLHLGRVGEEHRLKGGFIKIKLDGGEWLRQPFLVSDNLVRKNAEDRCDSFVVYYEVEAKSGKKAENSSAKRQGSFLIQRRWRRGEKRPQSFFAAKSHFFKPFE